MAAKQTEERPVRMCDVCGGVDDHPRHVIAYPVGEGVTEHQVALTALDAAGEKHRDAVLAQITDTATMLRHMDCCRDVGCPDGSCDQVTQGAEQLRGAELVEHLTKERD